MTGQSDEVFGLDSATLARSVRGGFILSHNHSPRAERSQYGSMQYPSPGSGSEAKSSQVISAVREYARKLREFCVDQERAIPKYCEEISSSTIGHSYYLNHVEGPSEASSTFQSFEVSAAPVTNILGPFSPDEFQGSNTQVIARAAVFSTRVNIFSCPTKQISSDSLHSQRLSTSTAHCDTIYPPEGAEPDINTKIPVSALIILPTSSAGSCISPRILDLTTT